MADIRTGIFYHGDGVASCVFGNQDISPRTEKRKTGLRCFSNTTPQSTYAISNIPGLNHAEFENTNLGGFKSNGKKQPTASTAYLKIATQGGRKDLLYHEEFQRNSSQQNFQSFKNICKGDKENLHQNCKINIIINNNNNNSNKNNDSSDNKKLKTEDYEIPLVEQLVRNTESKKFTRPELLPVDNKAKLYFSYNRNDGKISRIITSAPRPFKFGRQ